MKRKTSRKNKSRKNKKTKRNVKKYSRKNKMRGGVYEVNIYDEILLERIRENDPTLTEIYFDFLDLKTTEEANILANALKNNTIIKNIYTPFTHKNTAIALAEALKENTSIIYIDIGESDIGDKGAEALAKAFEINNTLRTIVLDNNKISDYGAKAILEALKVNTTLTNLILKDNTIDTEILNQIKEKIEENKHIQLKNINNKPTVSTTIANVNSIPTPTNSIPTPVINTTSNVNTHPVMLLNKPEDNLDV
jgi:ribosomal protein S25